MRAATDEAPASYVESGVWPNCTLRNDAPVSAAASLLFAQRVMLYALREDVSNRELARRAMISAATISRIMSGKVYCDVGTLARLQAALHADLWPGWEEVEAFLG